MVGVWAFVWACLVWGGAAWGVPGVLPAVERVVVGHDARWAAVPLAGEGGGVVDVRGPGGAALGVRVETVALRELGRDGARWLGVVGGWSRAEGAGLREGEGDVLRVVSVVVVTLPEGEEGVELAVNGGVVAVVRDGSEDELGRWAEAAVRGLPESADRAGLVRELGPGLGWPAYRGRAGAMLRTLGAAVTNGAAPAGPGEVREVEGGPGVIELLAEQESRAWARGLARLRGESDELAERVAKGLVRIVVFEGGRALPMWPEPTAEAALREVLIDEHMTGAAVRSAAESFLGLLPGVIAWVVDDTGLAGADAGHVVSRVGIANLGDAAGVAWVDAPGAEDAPAGEPALIAGGGSAVVEAGVALGVVSAREAVMGAARPVPTGVVVRLGALRATVGVRAVRLPVVPPGATLGPLVQDWTMGALWRGVAEPPKGAAVGAGPPRGEPWLTAARLTREPGADGGEGAWVLEVQCQYDPAAGTEGDAVEVWVGPAGRPDCVRRVEASGELKALAGEAGPERVEVRRGQRNGAVGVWWCRVPLPSGAMGRESGVRLGLVRRDARGVRSAFPRAMMPWQQEPGRLMLDVGGWDLTR